MTVTSFSMFSLLTSKCVNATTVKQMEQDVKYLKRKAGHKLHQWFCWRAISMFTDETTITSVADQEITTLEYTHCWNTLRTALKSCQYHASGLEASPAARQQRTGTQP